MKNILIIGEITLKEGIRNRILYGVFILALLLCAANFIFTHMFTYDLGKVAVDIGLSMASFSGLIIIIFLGLNLIAKDLDKKTIHMVLSRPIARWEYVLGKFTGLAILLFIAIAVLGTCAVVSVYTSTLGSEGYIPPHFSWATFGIAIAYLFLSLLIITSVMLFFASVTSSAFIAMLLSLAVYFVGQNIELVRSILSNPESMKLLPAREITKKAIEWCSWIFPNLAAFDLKTTAAYGLEISAQYLCWTAVYGIIYIFIILALTTLAFQKKELT